MELGREEPSPDWPVQINVDPNGWLLLWLLLVVRFCPSQRLSFPSQLSQWLIGRSLCSRSSFVLIINLLLYPVWLINMLILLSARPNTYRLPQEINMFWANWERILKMVILCATQYNSNCLFDWDDLVRFFDPTKKLGQRTYLPVISWKFFLKTKLNRVMRK